MSTKPPPPITAFELRYWADWVKRNFHAYVPPEEIVRLACGSQQALIASLNSAADQLGVLHPDQECVRDTVWGWMNEVKPAKPVSW